LSADEHPSFSVVKSSGPSTADREREHWEASIIAGRGTEGTLRRACHVEAARTAKRRRPSAMQLRHAEGCFGRPGQTGPCWILRCHDAPHVLRGTEWEDGRNWRTHGTPRWQTDCCQSGSRFAGQRRPSHGVRSRDSGVDVVGRRLDAAPLQHLPMLDGRCEHSVRLGGHRAAGIVTWPAGTRPFNGMRNPAA
jgi:hypothetical protein